MANNFFLYIYKDNTINITFFCNKEDRDEFIEKNKDCKLFYSDSFEPLDLFYYDAFQWDNNDNKPFININKAKEIQLSFIKETIRCKYFKYLDMAFMRSLEEQDSEKTTIIVNFKKRLRDLNIDELPNNLTELKNFQPQVFLDINLFIQNQS